MADEAPAPVEPAAPEAPTPAPTATPAASEPAASATPSAPTPTQTPEAAPGDVLDSNTDQPVTQQTWPADWREKLSGGDDKTLKLLQRLSDPDALVKKLVNQEKLISSGQVKKALDPNATPEQLAAYRQEHGIPETPEGYFEKLTDGLVIGEDDKPYFGIFAEDMHANNVDPKTFQVAVESYNRIAEQIQTEFIERQREAKSNTEEALRQEWGPEYKANINGVRNLVDTYLGDFAESFRSATLPDGTQILNSERVLKALAAINAEINPAVTVVPNVGGDPAKSIDGRIAELEGKMKSNIDEWHRHPEWKEEHRKLLDAKAKMQARGA